MAGWSLGQRSAGGLIRLFSGSLGGLGGGEGGVGSVEPVLQVSDLRWGLDRREQVMFRGEFGVFGGRGVDPRRGVGDGRQLVVDGNGERGQLGFRLSSGLFSLGGGVGEVAQLGGQHVHGLRGDG